MPQTSAQSHRQTKIQAILLNVVASQHCALAEHFRAHTPERGLMATKILWCDDTWSPVTGCSKVSTG